MRQKSSGGNSLAVIGGLAIAMFVMAVSVAQAEELTKCMQCKRYWGWWAANHTLAEGGCSNYVSVNQGNHRGMCINAVIAAKCKATCDANPDPVPVTECAGEPGIFETCKEATKNRTNGEPASGPCNQESWEASCDSQDSAKRCASKQVNQKVRTVLPSVCYVNCVCQ
jgi:hypothetical protein